MGAIVDLADNWIQLRRLGWTVWTNNETAIRLYERFGFTIEGRFIDAQMMGRVRKKSSQRFSDTAARMVSGKGPRVRGSTS